VSKNLFFAGVVISASSVVSPPLALLGGLLYALGFAHPYPVDARRLSSFLLQASVVGLGFGMDLRKMVQIGESGFVYTAASICVVLALGLAMGRWIRVSATPSFLISAGTAICGGSAIAAVGPIANAAPEEMAVALGTVFVLNSAALLLFPWLGSQMHLSQAEFGLWSALAIHDTSSVVGATAKYGSMALAIGTTVKLARALWIIPVSMLTAAVKKSRTRINWPWFILLFCVAAVANTYVPVFGGAYPLFDRLGKAGLTVTLFLIGTGLSKDLLRQVGIRPLAHGVLLWAIIAIGSLELIRRGWIHL
jgi:uncharacterized integral membrane protein (TIGR00698 family)